VPSRAPSQVRVETLIARGRLVLALFSLVAVPLTGGQNAALLATVSLSYLAYAAISFAVVRTRFGAAPHWPGATHAIDLAVYGGVLLLTGGLALQTLAWFVFALVAATLRWGWRGTLTTGSVAIALHVAFGALSAEVMRDPRLSPAQFITMALLMGVVTMLVGLVGAYEDWRGAQLARLAAWSGPDPNRPLSLPTEMLAQTALVLEARRTLLVWEEADEPWTEFALWADGKLERFREPPDTFGEVVAERVREASFFCRNLAARPPTTFLRAPGGGLASWNHSPIEPRLAERFRIQSLAVWPLSGTDFRGWLFCLDKPGFSFQDLTVGEVVADLTAARLSQAFLVRTMRETAVATERLRLARDLHDGVLQTLTGAALQLQTARRLLTADTEAAEERLSQVQRIIAAGQNDLRFFIRQLGPARGTAAGGPIDLKGRVAELADRIRRQWGVPVNVAMSPESLSVPDYVVNDVFLLIHEALVNAARHSRATSLDLALLREPGQLSIAVADDGQGFPFHGEFTLEDLARNQTGPRTLRERVSALGGSLLLESSPEGSRIRLAVPLEREAS
jgi:signal transduction histidine kinase